jgi:DNA adenine methylase
MILRRLGNKRQIAKKILPLFPDHKTYVEPFFGAGGMFFSKPKAQRNILNDLDMEVYNLFKVLLDRHFELAALWAEVPIHQTLWDEWRHTRPEDPVEAACRFLMLSNFGYMGKPQTLRFPSGNGKKLILERMEATRMLLWDCDFTCRDFRQVIRQVPRDVMQKDSTFIYCDPPYLGTDNNYQSGFQEADTRELMHLLVMSGAKFAMSEFDHPVVTGQAAELGLQVTIIGERKNLKNRRTEILVTNYNPLLC